MRLGSLLAASCAALALCPAAALAADYDPPIFVEEAPEWVPVEIGSGWYLRGDVGYAVNTSAGRPTYRSFDPGPPAAYAGHSFDTASLSKRLNVGGGFGYHLNDWLRADATLERLEGRFSGRRTDGLAFLPGAVARTEDTASMTAYAAMLNGYVDLGTFVGVTPYLGAGAGFAYVKWDGLRSREFDALNTNLGVRSHPGASGDWRFTWALMAGGAYELTDNLKLDVGYKYRRVEGGPMFGFSAAETGVGASGGKGRDDGFSQHEIRVGLRYDLW